MKEENVIAIDQNDMDLARCTDMISGLLEAVRETAKDYYNSTPVISLLDELSNGSSEEVRFYIPIDLKVLGVIAAIAQAPLALRGGTDKGKTAIAERILTALFGTHGADWWRMEINRGITIDDLIDVDVEKLSRSKLSEAIAGAKWLGKPARLLDEMNRVHPKLLNLILHLADGSGFNVRGDLSVPVGQPYQVNGEKKRYSFSVTTANQMDPNYAGVFEEDAALTRRIVLSVDLDEFPPSPRDRSRLLANRRAKTFLKPTETHTNEIIKIYEVLPFVFPFSALAHLFLHYLAGRDICVRTRSGRIQPQLKPAICEKCHLAKSHRFCGRVGGLSEGLLLWAKELAAAIAIVRAAIVLQQVREQCMNGASESSFIMKLQRLLGTKAINEKLYRKFRKRYLEQLCVTGEDVKGAFVLMAPTHIWVDTEWLTSQPDFEGKPLYLFQEVAREGWNSMLRFLKDHHALIRNLSCNTELSPADQSQIEEFITTKDPAALAVISALRDEDLPLTFREELPTKLEMQVA